MSDISDSDTLQTESYTSMYLGSPDHNWVKRARKV